VNRSLTTHPSSTSFEYTLFDTPSHIAQQQNTYSTDICKNEKLNKDWKNALFYNLNYYFGIVTGSIGIITLIALYMPKNLNSK
jgi:hypothetical protein